MLKSSKKMVRPARGRVTLAARVRVETLAAGGRVETLAAGGEGMVLGAPGEWLILVNVRLTAAAIISNRCFIAFIN